MNQHDRAAQVQQMYTQRNLNQMHMVQKLLMVGSILCAVIGFLHGL